MACVSSGLVASEAFFFPFVSASSIAIAPFFLAGAPDARFPEDDTKSSLSLSFVDLDLTLSEPLDKRSPDCLGESAKPLPGLLSISAWERRGEKRLLPAAVPGPPAGDSTAPLDVRFLPDLFSAANPSFSLPRLLSRGEIWKRPLGLAEGLPSCFSFSFSLSFSFSFSFSLSFSFSFFSFSFSFLSPPVTPVIFDFNSPSALPLNSSFVVFLAGSSSLILLFNSAKTCPWKASLFLVATGLISSSSCFLTLD
mmetsp:Transcript_20100/g.34621  ORF Transcript_20100/g.34621 Transcript_20100/m.34621 type:complete len:252 (-) Transcript_20100:1383-2138(-)